MRSQAETIERFEAQTTPEILLHFEAIERAVIDEQRGGVKDLVLFRLRRWKRDVLLGDPESLRLDLEKISGLSAHDYAFAKRAYLTAALLLHRALELAATPKPEKEAKEAAPC
jgi:hypothetical protein